MQSILADSPPHRGRAIGIAAALVTLAAVVALAVPRPAAHARGHHPHHRHGHCSKPVTVYLMR